MHENLTKILEKHVLKIHKLKKQLFENTFSYVKLCIFNEQLCLCGSKHDWGIPFETPKTFLGFPIFFFTNLKTYPKLTFFSMWNETNSLQIFYVFKVSFFAFENKNKKNYPMWAMFYEWPSIPINFIFFNLVHCKFWALDSCHIWIFYTH